MASPAPLFHNFGASHLAVLVLTVTIPMLLANIANATRSEGFIRAVAALLIVLLTANFFAHYLYHWEIHDLSMEYSLPIQLCDCALVATLFALRTRHQYWFDLAYFWGLGGTLQAIITPNLSSNFPSFNFISFFITHSGIVIGVLFMVFAMHLRPHPISLLRVLLWSEIYLAFTLLINKWVGGNYGFLSHKPHGVSLLSFFSDWNPLYILEMNVTAVVLFLILYSPFFWWIVSQDHIVSALGRITLLIPITIRDDTIRLVLLARGSVVIPLVIRDSHRSSSSPHTKIPTPL